MRAGTPRDEGPSIRRHLVGGAVIALLLTAGLGGWAATTELAGAVIASGSLVVDSNVKKVQHLTGGIVGELLVREGSRVRAGDVVVRLESDDHACQPRHSREGIGGNERPAGPPRERTRPRR